ncbi:MAG: D-glucuronyl C5-epimerase family protein [Bacteroidia bacterium]|nr:D-glucuronyl C5-epimerase family protein [Bacteroidia bacterium]
MWDRSWKFAVRNVLKIGDRLGQATGISTRKEQQHQSRIDAFYDSIYPANLNIPTTASLDFTQFPYLSVSYRSPSFWERTYQMSDAGLPLVPYKGEEQPKTNIVTTAQYGLSCYDAWKAGSEGEEKFKNVLKFLLDEGELKDGKRRYPFHFDWPAFDLKAPWYSALAQAQVVSLLLRGHQEYQDETYLVQAREALGFLFVSVNEGGLRQATPEGRLWLEEYPSENPSLVLNGFVSTVIALLEMRPLLLEEEVISKVLPAVESLIFSYKYYDLGWWLLYDRVRYVPITEEYMRFQILQLEQLQSLCPMPFWNALRERLLGFYEGRKWNFIKDMKGLRIKVGL